MSYRAFEHYDSNAVNRLFAPDGSNPSGYARAAGALVAGFMPPATGLATAIPIRVGRLRAALWGREDVPQWKPEEENP